MPVVSGLPLGWSVHAPHDGDVDALVDLLRQSRRALGAGERVDAEAVAAELVGQGSWTRRQVLVRDADGALAAWAGVHDRAAGRTNVTLEVSPGIEGADVVAASLLGWIAQVSRDVMSERGVERTVLDSTVSAVDTRRQAWLARAGYACVRRWQEMVRPVEAQEAGAVVLRDGQTVDEEGFLAGTGPHEVDSEVDSEVDPEGRTEAHSQTHSESGSETHAASSVEDGAVQHRPGVRVRVVATHGAGLPVADDLRTVHSLLEESFTDHFNSHRESLAEFLQRLRESPGHSWDQWWIAEVDVDGEWVPGGALVGSVLPEDAEGFEGSYVEYLGVHRIARGRGVAKALLETVIADAAARGRDRVGLEVDATSPTRADALYASMGWRTDSETQSWHRELSADSR